MSDYAHALSIVSNITEREERAKEGKTKLPASNVDDGHPDREEAKKLGFVVSDGKGNVVPTKRAVKN